MAGVSVYCCDYSVLWVHCCCSGVEDCVALLSPFVLDIGIILCVDRVPPRASCTKGHSPWTLNNGTTADRQTSNDPLSKQQDVKKHQ